MIVERTATARIELIDTEDYINKEGYYEIDFYPGRKFDKEVYLLFYGKEAWGNVHWYRMFDVLDKQNTKVIIFSSYNFLPILRNFAHKIYLDKTEINTNFYCFNTFF